MPKMTIDFMDGSREVFEVPQQTDHLTARRVRLDMFLEGRYLILEDENLEKGVLFYPIENIKCIRVDGNPPGLELPPPAVRGARRITEEEKARQQD